MKRRVARYLVSRECPSCHGKRLRAEALKVRFAGHDITEISRLPLKALAQLLHPYQTKTDAESGAPEKAIVRQRIAADLVDRLGVLLDLGLGYLTLERSTPTLSPGELQRLRLATQVRSSLFGVVYVMDEPSAGLHPADTEALLRALAGLRAAGNSLFVVEHALDVIRRADWIIDVGPDAGAGGGRVLYSGPPNGLKKVRQSRTAHYLFDGTAPARRSTRPVRGWLRLSGVTHNNLRNLSAAFPLGVVTAVTGVSGSGKSSLVSHALVELVTRGLGRGSGENAEEISLEETPPEASRGRVEGGLEAISRLVTVDQKPIGRTPRSNVATYTGLFDHVRKLFAATKQAKARRYDAGRFSFNVAKGRCPKCEGEGQVMVELLFLPSVYAPCPQCHGRRYNDKTLEVKYCDRDIAQVLGMSVDDAWAFFQEEPSMMPGLRVLREVGLGYLKLGQSATELSGGEAQRIKLATELQRAGRGDTLYVLDEPTTGLHPFDVDKLLLQIAQLADAGNTVVVVEHNMRVVAASDWVIDVGPGAGDEGGRIILEGVPELVSSSDIGQTSRYLARFVKNTSLREPLHDTAAARDDTTPA
jgi:excinuclease ABC subunit A